MVSQYYCIGYCDSFVNGGKCNRITIEYRVCTNVILRHRSESANVVVDYVYILWL